MPLEGKEDEARALIRAAFEIHLAVARERREQAEHEYAETIGAERHALEKVKISLETLLAEIGTPEGLSYSWSSVVPRLVLEMRGDHSFTRLTVEYDDEFSHFILQESRQWDMLGGRIVQPPHMTEKTAEAAFGVVSSKIAEYIASTE